MDYRTRESMSKMGNVDAQFILKEMAQWEFPRMFKMSLQFALFKVISLSRAAESTHW